MIKNKITVLILAVVFAAALLAGCGSSGSDSTAYVQNVGTLCGYSGVGGAERFAGVVSAKSEKKITADSSKTIKEMLVEVNQEVKSGDVLFTYDMDAAQLSLEKSELELEQLQNDVSEKEKQKSTLETEKASVAESEQLSYTLQIQTLETEIRETNYSITSKTKEIQTLQESLTVTQVTSPIDGYVQKVNYPSSSSSSDSSDAIIVLEETGNYRIKGYINENNINSISVGTEVVIRSRLDLTQTWKGEVTEIDSSSPSQSSDSSYSSNSDDTSTSSKYPFYVELESTESNGEKLLLGQHVYVEPGTGESASDEIKLSEGYFFEINGNSAYVWAENSSGKIEKRSVTLGDYDETLGEYVVTAGLTMDDYIAFPSDEISAGMSASEFDDSIYSESDEQTTQEDAQ